MAGELRKFSANTVDCKLGKETYVYDKQEIQKENNFRSRNTEQGRERDEPI